MREWTRLYFSHQKMSGRGGGRRNVRRRVQASYDKTAGVPRPPDSKIARAEVNCRKAWLFDNWSRCNPENCALVMNLGCGQGGDAHKIARVVTSGSTIVNVDFSTHSLDEFRSRVAAVERLHPFSWAFECEDVVTWTVPDRYYRRADFVCAMLCMHYFAEGQEQLTQFFTKVRDLLKPGASFVAVYPDPTTIVPRLDAAVPISDLYNEFNGELFSLEVRPGELQAFKDGETATCSYRFSLDGTMTRVNEYIITHSMLVDAVQDAGLTLCEDVNLLELDVGSLRQAMNLRGGMQESARELLCLYKAVRVTV
jgi:SAM-dependent methyltransferase